MMQIVAVVDADADSVIVWHVDISTVTPVLSRMCGAWVLTDEPNKLELLTRNRLVVATIAGAKAMTRMDSYTALIDLDETLNNIARERDRLQRLYEGLSPTRKKNLVAPRWPNLPTSTNTDPPVSSETTNPLVGVALNTSRYLEQLVVAWTAIEGQRTARAYLNEDTPEQPPAGRELPLAYCGAMDP